MKINKSSVKIADVEVFEYNDGGVIIISWEGDNGWGEYTLYRDQEGKWSADSEYMDDKEKKTFLKALLNKFAESIEVKDE